ncbi:MAG: hypothetical protein GTN74_15330 [Proteobacteria bacterium]|nr:hypothetical protein [Pseudomonadota bacterium]NIS71993.1 hypothetical protein [Pseudomonadota bacterium]
MATINGLKTEELMEVVESVKRRSRGRSRSGQSWRLFDTILLFPFEKDEERDKSVQEFALYSEMTPG